MVLTFDLCVLVLRQHLLFLVVENVLTFNFSEVVRLQFFEVLKVNAM